MKYANALWLSFLVSTAFCLGNVVPGDDFNANTATAVSTLQLWYNPDGLWDSTGWWNAANCVEAVENEIIANNDTSRLAVLQETFNQNSGGNFLNDYYDDEGWWANAWIRAYDLTGNDTYLSMAKTIFADMIGGWDDHCGGGIWWSKERTYKNAIPNELFLLVAIRLHQRTPGDGGAGSYFYWATNEWSWFKASGMINSQNLINDGLTADCQNNGQTTWSYNQGVILGGLADLYKVTGDTNYLNQAEAIADAAISRLVSPGGVLQEPCETGGGCGGGDVPQFKGIFVRNLAYLYDLDRKPAYFKFLYANAHSVWFNDRNANGQLGLKWTGPFDSADAARQSSAIMAVSALAAPTTGRLPFAKGAGDPAFDHMVGTATGTLAWACSPETASHPGYLLMGPYLDSLPAGQHVVHFRMAVDALNISPSNLVSLTVTENGILRASRNVSWNEFSAANQPQDFQLPMTNSIPNGRLEFRAFWNQVSNAPTLTLTDVTVDGARNWLAANLAHDVGRLDAFGAWAADPVRDAHSGYLVKGPGTSELPAGAYRADFELKVDNFNWDTASIAMLSVVNTDSGKVVASRQVARSDFPDTLYHSFGLHFRASAGAHYDFRTYWNYSSAAPRLTQRSVVVMPATSAQFSPIPLAPGSYNQDMVIERTAPYPPDRNTSASMDSGAANTANGWYERGYNSSAPATGLPIAGSSVADPFRTDRSFRLASSFSANNVAMVDASHSANLIPSIPARFSALSFLTASGHGPVTVDFRVLHADGSAETGAFNSPDWFFHWPAVFQAQGRVDVVSGTFNNVNSGNPRLYTEDITLANLASPISRIQLTWDSQNSTGGVAAIFAVSGIGMDPVTLSITQSSTGATLIWPFGTLLESANANGPWSTNLAAISPYQLSPDAGSKFYRIEVW